MRPSRPRSTSTLILLTFLLASAAPALAQSSAAPATSPAAGATTTTTPPATNCKPIPVTMPAPTIKKGTAVPGKNTDSNGRVVTKQTVTVSAGFTPEEMEDDQINQYIAYSFCSVTETNCQTVIDNYKTNLIPTAEQAKFPKNRAKYLEIAREAIGKCQMSQGRYVEAEQSFRDALVQADIWPGKNDSAYALLWMGLSEVQLRQDHWPDAAASGAQAAELLQARIDDHNKTLPTLNGAPADTVRRAIQHEHQWRSVALSNLSYISVRQENFDQAAKLIEQAYQDAVAGAVPPQDLRDIEDFGAHIADLTNNFADATKWSIRADPSSQPASTAPSAAAPAPAKTTPEK